MVADLKNLEKMAICNLNNNQQVVLELNNQNFNKESMNIVIVGHVDHGKSTIIGRLLSDTGSLPEGKLEQVKEICRRNSKPFEYAFLLDALKDEQEQGITIDAARCFFKTVKREYIIIDAPGHIEFLKNMVTGSSRAEAALLVIDANEGIQENSRRHGYLLSMLGIKKIAVLVNKMDLINYDKDVYEKIKKDYSEFLEQINIKPEAFVPVSGFDGINITKNSNETPWYDGKSVLELLDSFETTKSELNSPFRMPVQGIYKFTENGDNRRIIAGTIETGKIKVGDKVIFYPSRKKSTVKTIENLVKSDLTEAHAGYSTGFTLDEQIYIRRGEIAALAHEDKPNFSTNVRCNIFWLGANPLVINKEYLLKIGTAKSKVTVEKIERIINASNLKNENKNHVDKNDVAEIVLKTTTPIAFDLADKLSPTSRLVIIDDYEISGGGIIISSQDPSELPSAEENLNNNLINFEKGLITREIRARKYGQSSKLILLKGETNLSENIGKQLEKQLFDDGKFVYFMGLSNFENSNGGCSSNLYEVQLVEQIQKFTEFTKLLLESGSIVIASIPNIDDLILKSIKATINSEDIIEIATDKNSFFTDVMEIKNHLHDIGII